MEEHSDRGIPDPGSVCRIGHSDEGGATVSGGEAMSQFDFTLNTLMALTEEGIDTALDTTGFAPTDKILATLPYVNHYLYDLKHMDSAKHKEVIGVPNELILKNASELAKNENANNKNPMNIFLIDIYFFTFMTWNYHR